jgi:hypothetical protein
MIENERAAGCSRRFSVDLQLLCGPSVQISHFVMRNSQDWVSSEFLQRMYLKFQLISRDNGGEAGSGGFIRAFFARR